MPRFAANPHNLFNEVSFLELLAAAAQAGFQAVQFQVPFDDGWAHLGWARPYGIGAAA